MENYFRLRNRCQFAIPKLEKRRNILLFSALQARQTTSHVLKKRNENSLVQDVNCEMTNYEFAPKCKVSCTRSQQMPTMKTRYDVCLGDRVSEKCFIYIAILILFFGRKI